MAKNDKQIMFLGSHKPYEYVFSYYEMMRDSYNHMIRDIDKKMTPARKLYILGFKERIEATAKALGLTAHLELPANINKIVQSERKEELKEE